jgi:tubulin alpha
MREIISLHIGQFGLQIGNLCWELFCLEHFIQKDATMDSACVIDKFSLGSFFTKNEPTRCKSRCLFIDMDPSSITTVKNGHKEFC